MNLIIYLVVYKYTKFLESLRVFYPILNFSVIRLK